MITYAWWGDRASEQSDFSLDGLGSNRISPLNLSFLVSVRHASFLSHAVIKILYVIKLTILNIYQSIFLEDEVFCLLHRSKVEFHV